MECNAKQNKKARAKAKKTKAKCNTCKEVKKLTEPGRCSECKTKANQEWQKNNPEEFKAYHDEYRKKNRKRIAKVKAECFASMTDKEREEYNEARRHENLPQEKALDIALKQAKRYEADKEGHLINNRLYRKTTKGRLIDIYDSACKRSIFYNLDEEGLEERFIDADGNFPQCFYCSTNNAKRPRKKQTKKADAPLDKIRLDRWWSRDPLLGYRWGNVVPCCVMHNTVKRQWSGPMFVRQGDPFARVQNCPVWNPKTRKFSSGKPIILTAKEKKEAIFWILTYGKKENKNMQQVMDMLK
jgi:hypothetical protein